MSRRKPAVSDDVPQLDAEKVLALETMLTVRAEQNPADTAFVIRVARTIGLQKVVREVNRLNKFAARKSTGVTAFVNGTRRRRKES